MKLTHYLYQRLAIRLRIAGLQADVHRASDESSPSDRNFDETDPVRNLTIDPLSGSGRNKMKNSLASFALSAGLLVGGNAAAVVTSDRDATPAAVRLDSGTCLVVELSRSLNAKKLQPGDKVTAKVIQAVVVNGKVVIPRGSKLVGNVTETKAHSKEDPESRLGIIFGKAMMKNGVEVPVGAVVQALGPTQRSRVDMPDPMLPPQMGPPSTSSVPSPMGSGRNSAQTTGRGAQGTSLPPQNISSSLAPSVSRGTIPNPKEGIQENGLLSTGSRGIYGLPGLNLKFTGTAQIPVVISFRDNVKLESGIQMVLRVMP